MKKVLLAIMAVIFLTSGSFGFTFSLNDFGETPFDHNNNWAPITHSCGIGNLPSPGLLGESGEKFDLEGLKVASDDNYVSLALANSFSYNAHSTGYGNDLSDESHSATPEPTTIILFGLGLVGSSFIRRRK